MQPKLWFWSAKSRSYCQVAMNTAGTSGEVIRELAPCESYSPRWHPAHSYASPCFSTATAFGAPIAIIPSLTLASFALA